MGAGGDPFRRVRPGEAIRPTATVWNALMDLVRPTGATAQNGANSPPLLPAVVGPLVASSVYVASRKVIHGEAVVLSSATTGGAEAATLPLSSSLAFSSVERRLWNGFRPVYQTMHPTDGSSVAIDDPFAICVDSMRSRFALSGLAWVRVRALKSWHRFARRCLPQPSDDSTAIAASVGCLDSCGYGPAEVLGWAPAGIDPASYSTELRSTRETISGGTAGSIYWAVVRF
jgi:hypothetical protein